MTGKTILLTLGVGLGATAIMDAWAVFLRRAFNTPSLDYCLVGRWLHHMKTGVFRHTSIVQSEQQQAECVLGWLAHYLIGAVFAFTLVAILSPDWLGTPTLMPALLFGLATAVFPLVILQPAFGLGIAARRTPAPGKARQRSLMAHAAFGIGLYLSALVLSPLWQPVS